MSVFTLARTAQAASLSGLFAAVLLVGSISSASAIPYSTGGAGPVYKLGDTQSTQFDQLTLTGIPNGSFSGPGDIKLNDVTFVVDINALVPALWSYSINQDISIDGNLQTVALPFTVAINYSDTLTLAGGVTYWFPGWKLVTKELVIGQKGIGTWGGEFFGTLSAVPLPASLPLFAAGLAGLALLGRLRAKKQNGGGVSAI